jgi:hypothetical protein
MGEVQAGILAPVPPQARHLKYSANTRPKADATLPALGL